MNRVCAIVVWALVLPMKLAVAEDLTAALTPEELQTVSEAADRGLEWLSRQQNADGSFNGSRHGEEGPALHPTCFAMMAFMSRGHQPGQGSYGRQMSGAIDFVLSTQRLDGSMSIRPPEELPLSNVHPLCGLTLSEVYGSTSGAQAKEIGEAIERALAFSRSVQESPKQHAAFRGGWKYGYESRGRAEGATVACVPTTSLELMFMKSAHRAGFDVPQAWVDEGLEFIVRCYAPGPAIVGERRLPVNQHQGVFRFFPKPSPREGNWASFETTAASMLAIQLYGRGKDPMVLKAADWLDAHPVPRQGTVPRFYFGSYMLGQAMAQAGGKYWDSCFPRLVRRLLPHQDTDGHWRLDVPFFSRSYGEEKLGPAYNTALAVLCLTLPDQLLPIHQR